MPGWARVDAVPREDAEERVDVVGLVGLRAGLLRGVDNEIGARAGRRQLLDCAVLRRHVLHSGWWYFAGGSCFCGPVVRSS